MTPSLCYMPLILIATIIGTLLLATCGLSEPLQEPGEQPIDAKSISPEHYTKQLPPYGYQENGTLTDISNGLANLNYLTEEWAPFNYNENGNAAGISVEVLEAIFRDLGVNRSREDVRIVPLAEGLEAARNETDTVLFSIVRTPEREPHFKWAGPFTKASFVLFAPMARNITIASPENLNQYRIGAVQDSIENDLLIDQGVSRSHLISGRTPEDLLRMMEEGSIDMWATGDLAGQHQILKTAADPNAYEIVYTLSENDFYFIFSRDVPDALVHAFQHSLEAVKNNEDEQGTSD